MSPLSKLLRAATMLALVVAPRLTEAQKALVYCPVSIDATGCAAVKTALTSAYTGGVETGYDGSQGTVDLKTVDLFQYSVVVVPSLADDSTAPYALLRDATVASKLKAALLGKRAFWSGTPDQGVVATTRPQKDALIQNLAAWAGANFATVNAPGLVVLQDNSTDLTKRYDWVQAITGFALAADTRLASYSAVSSLTAAGNAVLTSNGSTLSYANMASMGFQTPSGSPGTSMDAVGQTGTGIGGQVVLITQSGANTGGAVVTTDRDDYPPGTPVEITGTGFGAGEAVSLLLHEDPTLEPDFSFTATADQNGAFVFNGFTPDTLDSDVRFVLTATGQASGRRAQTTFTDAISAGASQTADNASAPTGAPCSPASNSCLTIVKPTGVVNGDVLLAQITFAGGTGANPSTPTGWTQINRFDNGTTLGQAIYSKVISNAAGEPISYTWTLGNGSRKASGAITRYVGVDNTTPVVGNGASANTGTVLTAPSVNVPAASATGRSAMIVTFFGVAANATLSTPATMTQRYLHANTNAAAPAGPAAMASDVPQFNTGPSATYSSTSNQSAAWVAQTIVLDWVQTSSGSNPNQTTLTLTKPTNATAGDVLLAGLAYAGNVTISTVPAGWTLIQRRVNTNAAAPVTHVTYWKVATASEPASYTWTASSNVRSVGGITAYANIDPNSPIDAFASTPASDGTQAASATLTAPSLTTTAANDVVVVLFAITGNNSITTGPSGMLNRYDTQAGQTSVATSAFDALQAAAGSSGAKNATAANSGSWVSQTIALKALVTNVTTTTTLARTSGSTPSVYGDPVTFTATVAPSPGAAGTVTFKNGATVLCSAVPVSGGTATCTPTASVFGKATYSLTAEYSGAGGFLASTSSSLAHDVNAKPLTVTGITATSRPYDGTIAATLNVGSAALVGVLGGDAVTLDATGASGVFADADKGTAKTVTISGLTIAGTASGNYSLTQPTASADITARPIAIKADPQTKKFGAADPLTLTYTVTNGSLASGDSWTGVLARDVGENVGSYAITQGTLAPSAKPTNYALSFTGANLDITKASQMITFTQPDDPTYGASGVPLTGTASSGLPVTIIGVGACSVGSSGGNNMLAATGVGPCTVTASQGGNGNYDPAANVEWIINVKPATISVTSIKADDKVYDGTTAATISSSVFTGKVGSDVVTVSIGGATFDTKNVGTGKKVTATNVTLGGAQAGNYLLASAIPTTKADITQKPATASITATDKPYDGTATASATGTASGTISTDNVVVAVTNALFSDKNVGTGKSVTATVALGGTDGANYSLAVTTASTTASITPKQLSVASITVSDKVYDGLTSATITARTLAAGGVLGTDDVSLTGGTASFSDKKVGTNKPVSVTGLMLGGAAAGNYSLATTLPAITASITQKPITGSSITAATKVYDGTATAQITPTLGSGAVGGDDVSLQASGTFDDKNVGTNKTVTATLSLGGGDAGNYSLGTTTATTTANITPKPLTGSFTAKNKVYDGNQTATVASSSLPGILGSDKVTLAVAGAMFDTKNAGTGKTVTAQLTLGDVDAGNYSVNPTATAMADITPLGITGTITAKSKVYDGTMAAMIDTRSLSGVLGSDVVAYTGGSATFADKNVGSGKAVTATGLGLSGADALDYSVNTTASTTADITARPLTVSATGVNRVYNAATDATVTLSDNRVGGDVLTTAYATATFTDKNVGTGKTVAVSGITVGGTDYGNYSANATTTTTADITPFGITGSFTANPKVYDGNTAATIASRSLTGAFTGDVVSLYGGTATFDTKNVGSGKTVTGTGFTLYGTDRNNYALPGTPLTTTADITVRTLKVSATGVNKLYDGTTAATVTLSDDRVGGDALTTSYAAASFADKNAGAGKTVTVTGISVGGGGDAGNYSLFATTASTTATITPRGISFKVDDKSANWTGSTITPVYTLTVGGPDGFASGESLANFGTPIFTPASVVNVGTYTVYVSGLVNTNYIITPQSGTLTIFDTTKPIGSVTKLDPVAIGAPPTLYANFTDVTTGNSNIVAWRYSIDDVYQPTISITAGSNANVTATLNPKGTTDVVKVCVSGQDAGGNWSVESCALLAIYDPSAGFVTGGGWIMSPGGAYVADPTLTGKANFGFVSKYQKGANVPSGNTEFQFKEGNLNFSSTNFQWLVIQGTTMSQFKGTGTINGQGSYNFLVTAIDGDQFTGAKKPDSFRIKITNGSTVVYDNQMNADDTSASATVLGGGSIQIQSK